MHSLNTVYPWSCVAWDLAVAQGVDTEAVSKELELLGEDQVAREQELLEMLNTNLATQLWKDILAGVVIARDKQGKPLPSRPAQSDYYGPQQPYVWVNDINQWLNHQGRIDRWSPNMSASHPVSKHLRQEIAILQSIQELGFDPLNIPVNRGGTGKLKSDVRHALAKDPLFSGHTTFDKAWERLRANQRICDET